MTLERDIDAAGATRRQLVRFVGGPWDGDAARYYGLADHPDVVTSGGCHGFHGTDPDGNVVYVFRHG